MADTQATSGQTTEARDSTSTTETADKMWPGSDIVKKPTRRGGKRQRKKPYEFLTLGERERIESKGIERAERLYERHFREGRPVAPLNSTQFLIADHGASTPHFSESPTPKRGKKDVDYSSNFPSGDSSRGLSDADASDDDDEDGSVAGDDKSEFFEQDFNRAYQEYSIYGSDEICKYSKTKLVEAYIDLRLKVDDLERKLDLSEDYCLKLHHENSLLLAKCGPLDVPDAVDRVSPAVDRVSPAADASKEEGQ